MMEMEMLNTTESFEDLSRKANDIQAMCVDYKVPVDSLVMTDDLKLRFEDHELPLTQLATSHLCGKLNVPSRYFTRLVETGNYTLAAENINCWLDDPTDKRTFLLRGYAGMVRGVLSGSYSVYDAPEILETLQEVLRLRILFLKDHISAARDSI